MNRTSPINLLADDRGSALVEFALFVSLLIALLAGIVDYAFAVQEAIQVQEAAHAGAAFGAIPGNESNLTAIESAAKNAATGVPGFSATATNLWTCSAGGSSVSSTTLCTGGVTPFKYVVVKTSGTVPKPLSFPGTSSNSTVYGSATFRVPWSQ